MLIKEIVEDKGALWTKGGGLWPSISKSSPQGKIVKVVHGAFRTAKNKKS